MPAVGACKAVDSFERWPLGLPIYGPAMNYSFHRPAAPLAKFVHGFWESVYDPSHPKVRILPSATVELVINLSENEIRIYELGQLGGCRRLPGAVVAGAYARALDIDPMQHASMIGVHFRPGGAFPFFGTVVGELANSHVSLDELWRISAIELRERLCSVDTPIQRFRIMEDVLMARLLSSTKQPRVSLALELFGSSGMGGSVSAVADRIGLSQRRFIQLFAAHVGLTPKLFCRVLRFQHAREIVNRTATLNWAHLAASCGYYDQSHLIHDFQEFSGLTPSDYLDLRVFRGQRDFVPLIG